MDRSREAGELGGVAGGGVGTHQPANPMLPTSSTPSPNTVDPVKAFSIEKFMGEDYEHWSFRMRLMYTQYKLLDLVEGKEKMPEAAELKGAWMKRSFDAYMLMVQASALAINLNSQQPQWSVDYICARILEEDLRRRSVERSEEGAGYGVGGGKSGFKKKWKGKNKDNPKEDGGGGQGEVCFYCKKRGHRWRKCYQRPKDWTPPSSSNQRGGTRSGGVMGASGEEKDEEKGGKSEERKAGFFFFVNEGATDHAMAAKAAMAASMEESVTEEEQQGVQGEELIGGSAAVKASATSGQADWETWHRRLAHVAVSTLEVMHKEKCVHGLQLQGDGIHYGSCEACMQNKFARFSFPRAEGSPKAPLEVVHMDLFLQFCTH
ncbi:unnamed protein product [Closterium sp. NIES-65]|nr:unnamed protein product [Closterium sp. NIES-65]